MVDRSVSFWSMAGVICCLVTTMPIHAQSVAVGAPLESVAKPAAVTLNVNDVKLESVLRLIAQQAGLKLFVPGEGISPTKLVTMHVREVSANEAFTQALAGTGLKATIDQNLVMLKHVDGAPASVAQGSILGRIVDAKTKQGLRGAMVTLDDNTKGTTSGADGGFRMTNVAPGEHTLHVRMLGYVKTTKVVTVIEGQATSVEIVVAPSVSALDQVVVTGTIVATAQREIPNAMTVITARDIEQRGITQIQQLFRGDVPGLFAANNKSTGNPTDVVSMFSRGTTTLGGESTQMGGNVNTIKTYVDGVEFANPDNLNQIDPRSIERIEILTGPQASTIYGSNAINGVMQIFTKRGTSIRPQVTLTLLSGPVQNDFSSAFTPQHDYSVQADGTEGQIAYHVGGTWIYMGQWSPAGQKAQTGVFGGAKLMRGVMAADVSVRLGLARSKVNGNFSQILDEYKATGWYKPVVEASGNGQGYGVSLNGQTIGVAINFTPISWWSHELVLGSDVSDVDWRYRLAAYTMPSDSLLSLFQQGSSRTSVRYSTTASLPVTTRSRLVVTVGADGWKALSNELSGSAAALTGTLPGTSWSVEQNPGHNAGAFVQGQLGIFDALFLTYGLRAEWNPNFGQDVQPNFAPRYGVAYTRDLETPWGIVTAKLRGSYGRSTRPPVAGWNAEKLESASSSARSFLPYYGDYPAQAANPDLLPEMQRGGEGGVEFYFGQRGSLVVTRYNQTVDDLIASVVVDSIRSLQPNPASYYAKDGEGYGYVWSYENLNVGSIRNQGWETQSTLNVGPLTARGTYSMTKSRVIGVNEKYRWWLVGGQYQKGAMFLYLPEHTWALGVTYEHAHTSATLNVNGTGPMTVSGSTLYLTTFSSNIRLQGNRGNFSTSVLPTAEQAYATADLNISHQFSARVEGLLQVQNLTDKYHTDGSAAYATMGRQSKAGLRLRL